MSYVLEDVVAELTSRCNLSCMHCASSCNNQERGSELPVEAWMDIADQLAEMGVKRLVLSGGEPTIKAGFPRLIGHLNKIKLRYGFITNGFDLPDEVVEAISTARPFGVGVSLDGFGEIHNRIRRNSQSWSRAIATISRLKDLGVGVCVSTTINRLNWNNELDRLAKLVYLAELEYWQVVISMPSGRMAEQSDLLIDEAIFREVCDKIATYRQLYPNVDIQAADCFGPAPAGVLRPHGWLGCSAGITAIGIDATGIVRPCLSLRAKGCTESLLRRSLADIWHDSPIFDFNRKFRCEDVVGSCQSCPDLQTCRGGCASQSMSYHGRLHDAPFCYKRSFIQNREGEC